MAKAMSGAVLLSMPTSDAGAPPDPPPLGVFQRASSLMQSLAESCVEESASSPKASAVRQQVGVGGWLGEDSQGWGGLVHAQMGIVGLILELNVCSVHHELRRPLSFPP